VQAARALRAFLERFGAPARIVLEGMRPYIRCIATHCQSR
jgi:hypothetical protein